MSSIGEILRRERIRRRLDLDQISRELKISLRFLEAIEDDRFDKLPAGVFAKSFVRQYAQLLGLDAEELVEEVQRVLQPTAPEPSADPGAAVPHVAPITDLHLPRVEQWQTVGDVRSGFQWSSSLPALALVVVVMLVCSGVYSFWQRSRHPITAQMTPPEFQAEPAPAPAPPPAQPEPAPLQQAEPVPPSGVASAPAPAQAPPARPAPLPDNNSADRPTPEALATPAEPPPLPASTKPVKLQLTAEEPVWVLASANGKYLFSGTIEPNQTRSVEASGTVLLRLGNAGGLSITLNGKPIGAVGPKGQVREVQFTSGGFHIVPAPKPALPLDNPI